MADVLVVAPELYSIPPKSAIPGARIDVRAIELTAAQEVITNYFALGILPAGHKLVYAALESDDLDSAGPTVTVSVGILNTYYGQAPATVAVPAAYNSGGATNTGTAPELVTGQNIFTSSTVCQAGGRVYPSLPFTDAIGVDHNKDRIIAFYFPVAPTTAVAGTVTLVYGVDQA